MRWPRLPGSFLFVPLLAGFLFCIAVYHALLGRVSADEIEGLHTAWKILNGEVIYRDFFQHHHPLFYFLLVPILELGGETLLSFYLAELFAFAVFAALAGVSFLIAREIYGDRKTAWFALVLLLTFPYFIWRGTEIRPDGLQLLLGLLSFYFLVLYLRGKKHKDLVWSALLLSLAFLVLQKAIFLVFPIGLFLLYRLTRDGEDRVPLRDFMLYWTVFACLPAAYMVFLLWSGDWQNYFDFNWLLNIKYLHSSSPGRYISPLLLGFIFLFIAGCILRPGQSVRLHGFVALTGFCLLASLFIARDPSPQYLLPVAPFVAMVAAFALHRLFNDKTAKAWLVVFVFLCSTYLAVKTNDGGKKRNTMSVAAYMLEASKPGDLYFGWVKGNLFRDNTDFFWFCHDQAERCLESYQGFRDYDYNPVQIIMETRPRIIYTRRNFPFYIELMKHPYLAQNYARSPRYPYLFLRKNSD